MSTGRIDLDLSVARAGEAVNVNQPAWIRFVQVPTEFEVAVGERSGTAVPVLQPFTYKICGDPPRQIFVTNEVGSGTAIILWGDYEQELDDFLANAPESDEWEPIAILVPAADNTLRNLLAQDIADATQAGTTANVTYQALAATQRRVARIGIAASAADGYTIRETHNIVPLLDYLFAPAGVTRDKSFMPSLRWEAEVAGDIVYTAGELMLAMGFINRVAGAEAWGVGFFCAPARNGNNRWYAGVTDYSGGAVGNKPLPADQIIWQDTGELATQALVLAIEIGQEAGEPYISWQIDGVEVYRHDGNFPAWLDTTAVGLGAGFKAQHATLADTAFLYLVQARLLVRV